VDERKCDWKRLLINSDAGGNTNILISPTASSLSNSQVPGFSEPLAMDTDWIVLYETFGFRDLSTTLISLDIQ